MMSGDRCVRVLTAFAIRLDLARIGGRFGRSFAADLRRRGKTPLVAPVRGVLAHQIGQCCHLTRFECSFAPARRLLCAPRM
jgi:hypothetical protein